MKDLRNIGRIISDEFITDNSGRTGKVISEGQCNADNAFVPVSQDDSDKLMQYGHHSGLTYRVNLGVEDIHNKGIYVNMKNGQEVLYSRIQVQGTPGTRDLWPQPAKTFSLGFVRYLSRNTHILSLA